MMLVINNNNINSSNNYNCNNSNKKKKQKRKNKTEKKRSEEFHIYSHAKKLDESLANFNVYFLDIHKNLTFVRKRTKIF